MRVGAEFDNLPRLGLAALPLLAISANECSVWHDTIYYLLALVSFTVPWMCSTGDPHYRQTPELSFWLAIAFPPTCGVLR